MKLLSSVIACSLFSAAAFAEELTIPPEVLARPRLTQEEWAQKLGVNKNQTYSIVKGDTLWGISARLFSDAKLWRKLWQMNPELTNPHQIEIGNVLRFFKDGERALANVPDAGISKSNSLGATSNEDVARDITKIGDVKDRFRPNWIVLNSDETFIGTITGAYTGADNVRQHDEIYVEMSHEGFTTGAKLSIAREERPAVDATNGSPRLGTLVEILGEVELEGKGEKYYRAKILNITGPVKRGDRLLPLREPVEVSQTSLPPEELSANVIMGEDKERGHFGQGDLILINKGISDGVQVGHLFRVVHDTDPLTQSKEGVERSAKADVQVVQASQSASVAIISRSKEVVGIGDLLLPKQKFPDPPPPPKRNSATIEVD